MSEERPPSPSSHPVSAGGPFLRVIPAAVVLAGIGA